MQRFDCLAKETTIVGPHFLEASAGTGKTFAIEHVVSRLLLSGKYELEQILVVTFTRAAARELKLRIRSNLDRLISHSGAGPEYLEGQDLRLIQDALATFDRCQIFTIHSFCSRMLSEFSLEAGLQGNASQEPLDKREAGIRDFLESGLSSDLICPEQLDILLRWAGSVEELARLLKTTEAPIDTKTFARRLQEFNAVCPPLDASKLQEDWTVLQGNYKKCKGDLHGQIAALGTGNFAKLLQEKGTIFQFLSPENKKVRIKEPTFLNYPEFFDWGRCHLLPLIQAAADPKEILGILSAIWKPIDRKILLEEGILSNDELLHVMQKSVALKPFRDKVQQKYSAVLIDEFQDTDPMQWDIFERLFLQEGSAKTIYLIGDPKQSIYRFRKADLYTYLKAKESIPTEGHFYLDTNFRSSGELISALNHLFDRQWLHLPREKTTIPYIPVRPGLTLKSEFQDGKGAIHCVVIPKEEIFAYVAREILRMKTNFRDWAVLVKDRFEAAEMQRVLASVGIPSSCRGKEPLSDTLAFEAIREVLEALENPGHLGAAKRVLAGPFGKSGTQRELQNSIRSQICAFPVGFDFLQSAYGQEDMSLCKKSNQRKNHQILLAKRVMQFPPQREFSPFGEYRTLLDEKGLSFFFQIFFQQTSWIDRQFHSDCWQVLEHLFEWERKVGFSFDGAFRFFDAFARKDREDAIFQRKEEGEDDVQIMTVHMSKGLEFEIVFALGLASRTPAGDEEAEAEKMRQLYVATTRAKRRLYIPIPVSTRDAAEGTHAPMELFCQVLSLERKWEEELRRIASLASLTFETVEESIRLDPQVLVKTSSIAVPVIPLPPFQPSYLLSFTALSRGTEYDALDPLPEGDLPRGAETGVVIHRIFERIFSEKVAWKNRAHCAQIVHEELVNDPLSPWEEMVEKMVQDCLDLGLPQGFCLRDLNPNFVRPEVEFVFEDSPHFLKGFIDLIFLHEERLYFVDWKTNWLKKYDLEDLKDAIVAHKYDLQASIYAEALKHVGYNEASAIYLFVRGPSAICFEPNGY